MNLLKQTALVLGLVSVSLGGWSLYRNWRQKLAIYYAVLCFLVSGWALSFVSFATLGGRLSKDIHWTFSIWLAPMGVLFLSRILSSPDPWGRWLFRISFAGAIPLSLAIGLSFTPFTQYEAFWILVRFWPVFIFVEYVHVMISDFIGKRAFDVEFLSSPKRNILYAGIGISLALCSYDHIPEMGLTWPAIGNLLFAAVLAFVSQTVSPQKLLGLEAILSRFFAVFILSLVITGYFALLFQYMSESFSLFLLNSFLLSFAVLVLWNPLVTLFRLIAHRVFRSRKEIQKAQIQKFRSELSGVTSLVALVNLLETFFTQTLYAKTTKLEFDLQGLKLPMPIPKRETPVLHRVLIHMEREQAITKERRSELDLLIQYLDTHQCDLVFPVFLDRRETASRSMVAVIRVAFPTSLEEWTIGFSLYGMMAEALQEVGSALQRIGQVETVLEKDRLALMGEMAAGLAHEIRNPLGAIKGATELLLKQEQKNDAPWTQVIQEEVDRLNRLVSQFLDFSQSSPELPESVELYELLERSLFSLKPTLSTAVVLDLVPYGESIHVLVVPDQIQQVLINLVQNAAKANAARIQVQVFKSGFIVSDNGIGMSEDVLARVFEPFFSSFKTGSGLGLSICQRLVTANDGSIKIESKLGEGTKVKVSLCETRSFS